MKVAVVGAGISGISAAYHLQHHADVTLFDAERRIGGHTDSHSILVGGRNYQVDSGFIVFNELNYPGFSGWLRELGVESRPSDMSFAVRNTARQVEYGTDTFASLFCQRRNALRPRFLRMVKDLLRFYRVATLPAPDDARSLADWLRDGGYGAAFRDDHLLPMCSALWSLPTGSAGDLPARQVIAFMANHHMLQLSERPQWRVVAGGSAAYLVAFRKRFRGRIRTAAPVHGITRNANGVVLQTPAGAERFDALVLACHSDQALAALADPAPDEAQILGSIRYQSNRAVVHSDASFMPSRRAAWSSWNVTVSPGATGCQVTYWMNRLQTLGDEHPFFVTLNPERTPTRRWSEREYAHPVLSPDAVTAQGRLSEIQGRGAVWYCGAYWGWGFHEDGFRSGREVAGQLLREQHDAA